MVIFHNVDETGVKQLKLSWKNGDAEFDNIVPAWIFNKDPADWTEWSFIIQTYRIHLILCDLFL